MPAVPTRWCEKACANPGPQHRAAALRLAFPFTQAARRANPARPHAHAFAETDCGDACPHVRRAPSSRRWVSSENEIAFFEAGALSRSRQAGGRFGDFVTAQAADVSRRDVCLELRDGGRGRCCFCQGFGGRSPLCCGGRGEPSTAATVAISPVRMGTPGPRAGAFSTWRTTDV